MLTWDFMQLEDRVRMVASFFPTLAQEVVQQVIGEWAKNEYPATYNGEQRAIADLTEMFSQASLTEEQLSFRKARNTQLVKEQLKCLSK